MNLRVINGQLYRTSTLKLMRTLSNSLSSIPALCSMTTSRNAPVSRKKLNAARNSNLKLISVRGDHFQVDSAGRKLCRVTKDSTNATGCAKSSMGSLKHIQLRLSGLEKVIDDKTRLAASRAVNRSIAIAAAKYKKDNYQRKMTKKYCIFFGRFGKCHRGSKCPFIHDVDKVAVCTRFLRGKCDTANCPFSHKASVHRMPVCLFYLRGSCVRSSCTYLHVNVNPDAPVCWDFLNGFCSAGEQCKKLHSHVCPSFAFFGTCQGGDTCPMLHRRAKAQEAVDSSGKPRVKREVKGKRKTTLRRSFSDCNMDKINHERKDVTLQPSSSSRDDSASAPIGAQPSFISLVSSTSSSNRWESRLEKDTKASALSIPVSQKQKITPSFILKETSSAVVIVDEENQVDKDYKEKDAKASALSIPLTQKQKITPSFILKETSSAVVTVDEENQVDKDSKEVINMCTNTLQSDSCLSTKE